MELIESCMKNLLRYFLTQLLEILNMFVKITYGTIFNRIDASIDSISARFGLNQIHSDLFIQNS